MKKAFCLILAAVLSLTFTACTGSRVADVPVPNVSIPTLQLPDTSDSDSSNLSSDPSSSEPSSEPSSSEPSSSEPSSSAPSSSSPSSSSPSSSSPSSSTPPSTPPVTSTPTAVVNEFINNSNNFVSQGDLAIRPKHVYWDNNVLVAECYIVNGRSTPVYNINVYNITFNNRTQQIASASFGVCNGLVVQPYQSVVWTFKFGAHCIQTMGADLSYLECDASANYNY